MQVIRFSRSWSFSSLRAPLLALACWGGAAGATTIDPELAARLAHDKGLTRYPVVLRLAQQPDLAALAKGVASRPQAERGGPLLAALRAFNAPLQAPLLQELAKRKAAGVTALLTVNAVAAQLTAGDIRELAKRPELGSIRYDIGLVAPSRRAAADPCKPARPTPRQRLPKACREPASLPAPADAVAFNVAVPGSAAMLAVGAPLAWQAGYTGKGVTVAFVDSGVDARHPSLAASFRGGAGAWFDVHGQHAMPVDLHGHGTQIAGLVVGSAAGGQTLGVAPQASWIAARIYDDGNIGRLSHIHRIMAWLLDPDGNPTTGDAPQVVLNAWGLGDRPGTCDDEFARDLALLRAAGMHVVFAAGNGGPAENTSVSPANNSGVLAVGALDGGGQVALYSSRGRSACDARPYPDLLAPGEQLRTTDLSIPGVATTTAGTGTSFAAALVAGELALLTQARPALAAAEREALLQPGTAAGLPLLRALGLPAEGRTSGQP